jgi:glucosamine--fructose-6-phosphate aminotransferase (isomerizing)
MPAPSHFLQDIFRQPAELGRTIAYLAGTGRTVLRQAASAVRDAKHVFLTGIGASLNAALAADAIFSLAGRPVFTQEASELLHFTTIPQGAVVVAVSRTGRSIEIVQLLAKIRQSGASVVGITNSAEGALAKEATIPIVIPAKLDHAISVNTYSSLALAVGALATAATGSFDSVAPLLSRALAETANLMEPWHARIAASNWLSPGATYYFLARGPSLASCYQARLLWEEGAKSPATAMSTSGFRHGPQETVVPEMRVCLWIDSKKMRAQDFAVADDLKKLGASVMLIGQRLPADSEHLVFQLPQLPPDWQFVVDIIPVQLAAERLAGLSGVDCDSFRVCSYVVEEEHGLLGKRTEVTNDAN